MGKPWNEEEYNRSNALEEQVYAAWNEGRVDEAVALGEQWWEQVPDFDDFPMTQASSVQIAKAAAKGGRTDVARRWLERAREAYGGAEADDHSRSIVGMTEARIAFHEGNVDRAFDLFQASYDFLGKRVFDLPRDQAYWDFFASRAGVARKPVSKKSLEKLAAEGDQLQEAGDAEGAVAVWEQALAQLGPNAVEHPMAMWFYASIADASFELRRFTEANDAAAQALIAGGNDNGFVWLRKGQALVELGQRDAGVEALTSAYMLEGDEIFEDEDPKYRKLLVEAGVVSS